MMFFGPDHIVATMVAVSFAAVLDTREYLSGLPDLPRLPALETTVNPIAPSQTSQ